MTATLIQCPGCGATIDAPDTDAQTMCDYCGVRPHTGGREWDLG